MYITQHDGGNWGSSGFEQAATGAAAFALLSQQDKWGSNIARYQMAVDKAVAYLLRTANTIDVSSRGDGVDICPGGTGFCRGVFWYGNAKSAYATGLVAPAIAAYGAKAGSDLVATTTGPLAGMTWVQIAQGITNAFAASQNVGGDSTTSGGWGSFIPGKGDSDSASTHSAVISLLNTETLGAVSPDAVRADLKTWLGKVQNASGAVCYQPGTEPCDYADTGGWLLAMRFVGYDLTDSQVQAALFFLNANWRSTANRISTGNFGHPEGMWAVYTGLNATVGLNETSHISNVLTDCGASVEQRTANAAGSTLCTWSEDYNQWLVRNQNVDGSWGVYSEWATAITTASYVNILGATQFAAPAKGLPATGKPRGTETTPSSRLSIPVELGSSRGAGRVAHATGDKPDAASDKVRPRDRKGVTALAVNTDGSAIAGASTDNKIRIWIPTNGLQTLEFPAAAGLPTGLTFTGGGATLTSVGRDSLARVWDASSGSELAKLAGHEQPIRAVAASPDGTFVASAGEETRVMLWDQKSRKLSKILFGPRDFVNALDFSPDSKVLACGGEDARVLIFDIATGKVLQTLRGHSAAIDAVSFSPDGTILATGGEDTVIHLWDPASGLQRAALPGHSAPIRTIMFSPDGRLIASGGEDARIILWNATTGTLDKTLSGSTGAINMLVFDPKARFLASATEAGEITLWNVVTGTKLLTIPVPIAF